MVKSRPVISFLKKKFGKQFIITTEASNKLDLDNDAYYSPDLLLRDKKDNNIKAIIEVEQGARKHMVGGVITADYCIRGSKNKPLMCVLALHKQDKKDYLKRLTLLKYYSKRFSKIVIGSRDEIVKELLNLKS